MIKLSTIIMMITIVIIITITLLLNNNRKNHNNNNNGDNDNNDNNSWQSGVCTQLWFHQVSWIESTEVCGMRWNQAGGSSVQKKASISVVVSFGQITGSADQWTRALKKEMLPVFDRLHRTVTANTFVLWLILFWLWEDGNLDSWEGWQWWKVPKWSVLAILSLPLCAPMQGEAHGAGGIGNVTSIVFERDDNH